MRLLGSTVYIKQASRDASVWFQINYVVEFHVAVMRFSSHETQQNLIIHQFLFLGNFPNLNNLFLKSFNVQT